MLKIPSLQELLEAGVHFGHKVSRGNPKMAPFIYSARDGVHIIDLTQSEKGLRETCEFVKTLGAEGKILLFVGTKKQAQPIIEEAAKKAGAPYLINRWIGGFLTNFEEISKNIKKLKELKEQKAKGEFEKYTKKEQLLLDRKIATLEKDLGGVLTLDNLPDAVFITDCARENIAVKEAFKKGIQTVAITDTNCDPSLVEYRIPANDDATKSIKIIVETIASAYGEGKRALEVKSEKEKVKKEKEEAFLKKEEEEITEEVAAEVAVAEEKIEKEEVEEAERKE